MKIINGSLFCEDGKFHRMNLMIKGKRIERFSTGLCEKTENTIDAKNCYVVPGFLDIHIHGAMGADFSDGTPEAIETISEFLIKQGVTGFLGTSMALHENQLASIYQTARPYISRVFPNRAVLHGIYMEGPFFNSKQRGAQNPANIISPDFSMFRRLHTISGNNIRIVAMAPETKNGLEFVRKASRICHVSLGHSDAGYDLAHQAFLCGADHITHIFNGMSAFHHRDPGIVGAAIDSNAYIELICDGYHVHPTMIQTIFKLFGNNRICLISDAMRACGMPDGQYDLGGQTVTVAKGTATISTGSLAGSITTLFDCFRRAVNFGIPLESALMASTINPARSVGLDKEIGSLHPGKRADILILNPDMTLRHVLLGGQECFP